MRGRQWGRAATRSPYIEALILEADRTVRHRASREKAHDRLYDAHKTELAGLLFSILKRLDITTLAKDVVEHAQLQAAAGSTPAGRRRAVKGVALAAILAQTTHADRLQLDLQNAYGWGHATAYGKGEATATPATGGPPDHPKVASAAAVALSQVPDAQAQAVTLGWTDAELEALAMGAAMAAGDGAEFDAAVRKVMARLQETTGATAVYTHNLHRALNQSFVTSIARLQPTAWLAWVINSGNPCPICIELATEGPYAYGLVPTVPPVHFGCLCNLEAVSSPLLVGV